MQGFRSFVWTSISYQLKDNLKLSPSASQFVFSVAFFPWSIKPLYGYGSLVVFFIDYSLVKTLNICREICANYIGLDKFNVMFFVLMFLMILSSVFSFRIQVLRIYDRMIEVIFWFWIMKREWTGKSPRLK